MLSTGLHHNLAETSQVSSLAVALKAHYFTENSVGLLDIDDYQTFCDYQPYMVGRHRALQSRLLGLNLLNVG
jgi:hypothetical protein